MYFVAKKLVSLFGIPSSLMGKGKKVKTRKVYSLVKRSMVGVGIRATSARVFLQRRHAFVKKIRVKLVIASAIIRSRGILEEKVINGLSRVG